MKLAHTIFSILIFKNFQTSREDIESLERKNKALFNLNKELRKINEALDDSKQLLRECHQLTGGWNFVK